MTDQQHPITASPPFTSATEESSVTEHPIAPPPELEEEWLGLWPQDALLQAARWGADMELEACIDWIRECPCTWTTGQLRAARRPKPKSRKQRVLDALTQIEDQCLSAELAAEIRNALEGLPDD